MSQKKIYQNSPKILKSKTYGSIYTSLLRHKTHFHISMIFSQVYLYNFIFPECFHMEYSYTVIHNINVSYQRFKHLLKDLLLSNDISF